jgi:hypothetical protein
LSRDKFSAVKFKINPVKYEVESQGQKIDVILRLANRPRRPALAAARPQK